MQKVQKELRVALKKQPFNEAGECLEDDDIRAEESGPFGEEASPRKAVWRIGGERRLRRGKFEKRGSFDSRNTFFHRGKKWFGWCGLGTKQASVAHPR